jgi:coiled-coil domain-containing protein 55
MSKIIAKRNIKKALEEDPSIFEYDEVYDDIKKEEKREVKEEPRSRYIHNLIKHAESRKRDQEKRIEKKIQKERESEGGMFDDKETFVTSAYKQKLLEMQALEEEEQREKALEEAMDVKKQKDLSGFYKHFLNQTVGEEKIPQDLGKTSFNLFNRKNVNKNIRKRKTSQSSESSLEEGETWLSEKEKQKTTVNEDDYKVKSKTQFKVEQNETRQDSKPNQLEKEIKLEIKQEDKSEVKQSTSRVVPEPSKMVEKPKKRDRNELIAEKLTKRTIGEVFEAARLRYLSRCHAQSVS